MVQPIPEGSQALTPYLVIDKAPECIEFMQAAFDAREIFRMDNEDGTVGHAELEIGGSRIMLGSAGGENPPIPAMLHLYVEDCDKTYQKALEAGGTSTRELQTMFYGDRSGAVEDASGNTWWITTHVEDVSPEEMARRAAEQGS